MYCAFPFQGFALEPSEKLLFEKNSLYQYISVSGGYSQRKSAMCETKKESMRREAFTLNAPDKLLFEFTQMGFVSLAFFDRTPKTFSL